MPWWTLPLPPPSGRIITNKLFQELLLIVAFYHSNKWQIDCYLWSWGSCELLGNMLGVYRYQAALQSWRPCTLNKDTLRKAPTLQPDLRGHIWCSCANTSLFPEEVHFYLYKHLSAVLKAAKRSLVHKLLYTCGTVLKSMEEMAQTYQENDGASAFNRRSGQRPFWDILYYLNVIRSTEKKMSLPMKREFVVLSDHKTMALGC